MYRNIISAICCIIISMVLTAQNDISLLPQQGTADDVVEVWHTTDTAIQEAETRQEPVRQTLGSPVAALCDSETPSELPYIYKSHHLSCQHTRAGTSFSRL